MSDIQVRLEVLRMLVAQRPEIPICKVKTLINPLSKLILGNFRPQPCSTDDKE